MSSDKPCGCCEARGGERAEAPKNPPGLSSLAYRVGTHGSLKARMKNALAGQPTLGTLTTRADDDPAIALIDAWASVLDVLTFYQERIANEGFLRTATERVSLVELARTIGYELRPGVAAATHLMFTLDDAEQAPRRAEIPIGVKAQSIPKQGERAQTFETVEAVEARAEWNALRPRLRERVLPKLGLESMALHGTGTQLQRGDALLIIGDEKLKWLGSENWDFRMISKVEEFPATDPAQSYTRVTFERPLGKARKNSDKADVTPAQKNPRVYALRQRARIFGSNAPKWEALPVALRIGEKHPTTGGLVPGPFTDKNKWVDATLPASTTHINLDAIYPRVVASVEPQKSGGHQSWVVLAKPTYEEAYLVLDATEESKADYLLSASTTRLKLEGEHIHYFSPRNATVFAQSEELTIAAQPIAAPVSGDSIALDVLTTLLPAGRQIAVMGMAATTQKPVAEIATIKESKSDAERTTLVLTAPLANSYERASMVINANVARATHGESRHNEVLGSADGARAFQRFALKEKPLTYVSAATPSGTASTLEVRVNGLLWEERPSFYELGPADRAYVVRLTDDARTIITFGDGVRGARPPSGSENVRAKYRVGLGLDGLVEAKQISLLIDRPLGVRETVNPLPSTGAADAEKLEDARTNAPLTVLTLDRIVSLQDFEDFARAFAGIGKAQATLLWSGEHRLVHITVAAAGGAAIDTTSDVYKNLVAAIDNARHADRSVQVASHRGSSDPPFTFDIAAKLIIDASHIMADVVAAARSALLAAFSFDSRAFAQAVTASEVVAVLQRVDGVVAVDLDALHITGKPVKLESRLLSQPARYEQGTIKPAQLLTVRPEGITLTAVQS